MVSGIEVVATWLLKYTLTLRRLHSGWRRNASRHRFSFSNYAPISSRTVVALIHFLVLSVVASFSIQTPAQPLPVDGSPAVSASDYIDQGREAALLGAPELDQLRAFRSRKEVKSASVTKVNISALSHAKVVTMTLPDGKKIKITRTASEDAEGGLFWTGETDAGGLASFLVTGPSASGTVRHSGFTYWLRRLGEKYYVLVEIDVSKLPPAHLDQIDEAQTPQQRSSVDNRLHREVAATAVTTPSINILIAYTLGGAMFLGNVAADSKLAASLLDRIS